MRTSCVCLVLLSSLLHQFSGVDCFLLDDSPREVQYTIETRVIVDKYAFNSWNSYLNTILLDKGKANQPRAIITDFIKSLFVGVNGLYENLDSSGIRMDVRIVSIEFITDESIATETKPGSGFVNVDSILDQFVLWLATKHYPRTDHVMLITGLNMTNATVESEPDKDPLGVASLGKMCSIKSVSAVQSIPNSEGANVIAHELGHSLNASHDGEGNSCSNETMNLMAATVHKNTSNVYHFSPCSIKDIKDMLTALDHNPEGNCLSRARTTTAAVSGVRLGKLFTADQICQMSKGNHSHVCRSLYGYNTLPPYSNVCGAVWCLVETGRCQDVFSTDGMSCGSHKECYQGACLQSSTAPAVSETCVFGDTPWYSDTPVFTDTNDTCSQLLTAQDLTHCYEDSVRRSCCGSCEAGLTSIPDCAYGDKSVDCANMTYPYACNDPTNKDVCCGSCEPYYDRSASSDCAFGDKQKFCATMDHPYGCGLNADECCASCKPYYNASRTGCEYGDKNRECKNLTYPYACYDNHDLCCESCAPYHDRTSAGCEYGDKTASCVRLHYPQDCYANPDACCGSCAPYYDPHRVGCEYGDKNPQCKVIVAADRSRCQAGLSDTCCLSCADTTGHLVG